MDGVGSAWLGRGSGSFQRKAPVPGATQNRRVDGDSDCDTTRRVWAYETDDTGDLMMNRLLTVDCCCCRYGRGRVDGLMSVWSKNEGETRLSVVEFVPGNAVETLSERFLCFLK